MRWYSWICHVKHLLLLWKQFRMFVTWAWLLGSPWLLLAGSHVIFQKRIIGVHLKIPLRVSVWINHAVIDRMELPTSALIVHKCAIDWCCRLTCQTEYVWVWFTAWWANSRSWTNLTGAFQCLCGKPLDRDSKEECLSRAYSIITRYSGCLNSVHDHKDCFQAPALYPRSQTKSLVYLLQIRFLVHLYFVGASFKCTCTYIMYT